MISSVIAKLNCDPKVGKRVIDEIASHPALEIGDLVDGRMLPVTIESQGNQETEAITRWMQSLEGVAFVDVVFVHFEDGDLKEGRPKKGAQGSTRGFSVTRSSDGASDSQY